MIVKSMRNAFSVESQTIPQMSQIRANSYMMSETIDLQLIQLINYLINRTKIMR